MTWMNYRRPGALGLTRVRLTRGRRRVLLALLSGADNLDGWRICQAAQVWSAMLYPFLDHLEEAGWVQCAPLPGPKPRHYYWSLTEQGRINAAGALQLVY